MKTTPSQQGFSAVELLITLFIAAIFVISGYQLYTIAFKNSTEANQQAQAANLGYEYLRKNTTGSDTTCSAAAEADITPQSPPAPAAFSYPGLSQPKIYKKVDCPFGTTLNIAKITIRVTYATGSGTKEVSHATYTR